MAQYPKPGSAPARADYIYTLDSLPEGENLCQKVKIFLKLSSCDFFLTGCTSVSTTVKPIIDRLLNFWIIIPHFFFSRKVDFIESTEHYKQYMVSLKVQIEIKISS